MKYDSICIALVLIAATCFPGRATSEPNQSEAAAQLFKAGKFTEAGDIYARIVAQDPKDYSAILQLGRVALLANRLDDAQRWLEAAIALHPDDDDAKVMLAETFYRRDDFQKAAAALRGVEVGSNRLIIEQYPTLNVAKLESFRGQTPYEVHGDGQTTRIKFLNTASLPVVSVRVNGGDEVTFFIDTGGSELWLDTDFAKELGLPQFGDVQGTFAGGEQAKVGQSRIESLKLGDWTVQNLPVMTLPFRQLSAGLGVKRIDGVIGTTLFYHFLTTLDFPRGELVLRRKNAESLKTFTAETSEDSVAVPFWMASDHFMAGWGRVETMPPALLFVDTGLAGAGVKLAEPVIKAAGIKLEEDKASEGAGAAGTLKVVPYTVRQLSFGDMREDDVAGVYDGPFPWENTFGFHLAGMVGHDFVKPFAVTFDFETMRIFLTSESTSP
jgi:predicted aspartyl protease/Tfp pilus assembly protein PilF